MLLVVVHILALAVCVLSMAEDAQPAMRRSSAFLSVFSLRQLLCTDPSCACMVRLFTFLPPLGLAAAAAQGVLSPGGAVAPTRASKGARLGV